MKVGFILKGIARHKQRCYPVVEQVQRLEKVTECRLEETRHSGHAIDLAQQMCRDGLDVIIAVGGDGTLHEVLNGALTSGIPENALPALGILPLGTANDFVRSAQVKGDGAHLLELLQKSQWPTIDVGWLSCTDKAGQWQERYFLNIADVGMGGWVVDKVNASQKRLGGKLTFFRVIVQGLLTYVKQDIVLEDEQFVWQGKLLNMAVCNGRYFGHGMCISPQALLDDRQLEVVIIGDISLFDYLMNLGNLKKGKVIDHKAITYQQTTTLKLTAAPHLCHIEADGEFIGYAPATIKLSDQRIRFLMDG